MRIVFMGTPAFAVPTLEHLLARPGDHVEAVFSQPDRPSGRGRIVAPSPVKELAVRHAIPVHQPERLNTPAAIDLIHQIAPDVIVVVAYGQIIPRAIFDHPRHRSLNVHASLLPAFRGAAPVSWAIINGERETGVSIMRITARLDAGPVLRQARCPIGEDETARTLAETLSRLGAGELGRALDDVARGAVREVPQDESRATYARRLNKADGEVAWDVPAARVHNLARGLWPWPTAFSHLRGRQIALVRTRVAAPASGTPGTVIEAEGDRLIVACGEGTALQILQVQPAGRRTMSAREFLTGRGASRGERFTGAVRSA